MKWMLMSAAATLALAAAHSQAQAAQCSLTTTSPASVTINYDPLAASQNETTVTVIRQNGCGFTLYDDAAVANQDFSRFGHSGPITRTSFAATYRYPASWPCDLSGSFLCEIGDGEPRSLRANGQANHQLKITIPAGVSPRNLPAALSLYMPEPRYNPNGKLDQMDSHELRVLFNVIQSASLSFAGGGSSLTMDFGTLATGQVKSVNVMARASAPFRVKMTSDMGSALKLNGQANSPWSIPYTATLNGSPIAPNSDYRNLTSNGSGGVDLALPFQVTIGDASAKKAGAYRDVVTLQISPL